jgi:hypothetical protein
MSTPTRAPIATVSDCVSGAELFNMGRRLLRPSKEFLPSLAAQ